MMLEHLETRRVMAQRDTISGEKWKLSCLFLISKSQLPSDTLIGDQSSFIPWCSDLGKLWRRLTLRVLRCGDWHTFLLRMSFSWYFCRKKNLLKITTVLPDADQHSSSLITFYSIDSWLQAKVEAVHAQIPDPITRLQKHSHLLLLFLFCCITSWNYNQIFKI